MASLPAVAYYYRTLTNDANDAAALADASSVTDWVSDADGQLALNDGDVRQVVVVGPYRARQITARQQVVLTGGASEIVLSGPAVETATTITVTITAPAAYAETYEIVKATLLSGPVKLVEATVSATTGDGSTIGNVLTAVPALFATDANQAAPVIVNEWLRNGTPISGANGLTYTITASDLSPVGISFRQTATDAYDSAESAAVFRVDQTAAQLLAQTSSGSIWAFKQASTLFSDAGSTLAAIDGTVQQVNDFAYQNRNWAQSSAGSRPTRKADGLLFDGSADHITLTAPFLRNMAVLGGSGLSIVMRLTRTDNIAMTALSEGRSSSNNPNFLPVRYESDGDFISNGRRDDTTVLYPQPAPASSFAVAVNDTHTVSIRFEPAGTVSVRIDGGSWVSFLHSISTTSYTLDGIALGALFRGTPVEYFNGTMQWLGVFNTVLSDANFTAVENEAAL